MEALSRRPMGREWQDESGERHSTVWLPTMAAGRDGTEEPLQSEQREVPLTVREQQI